MTELSPDQEQALGAIERFIHAPRRELVLPYFVLHGLAGTGKTFLMAQLARKYAGNMIMCAFTGKAASVLRAKVGLSVSTIHSAIYDYRGSVEDDFGDMQPVFTSKELSLPDRVILVDEVSMVGQRISEDLLATGARLICCGDPGQLPPVRDSQFFTDPDATLKQIHRQALGSPIIRQAHRIRSENNYCEDGPEFRVIPRALTEDLLGHEMIICWRNKTRVALNAKKRTLLGLTGPLRAGEPVMCLRNDHRLGIYNGAIYELARNYNPDEMALTIRRGDDEVYIEPATIEGDPRYAENCKDEDTHPFAPAYACTAHKSQGSEWPSVLVFDEAEQDWANWMYTAITRAAERVTVVRWRS